MEDTAAGGFATGASSATSTGSPPDDLRVEGTEPFWDALRGLQQTASRAAQAAERAADAADRAADAAVRAVTAAELPRTEVPAGADPAVAGTRPEDVDRMFAQARADRAQAWADREAARRMRVEVEQERERWQTDELTGVLTRRAGEERTRAEIERAVRLDAPLACVFLDVAGLKAVNDSLGHAAGDDALRAVAKVLVSAVRAYDAVFRYGGDEFVCVLPEAALDAVERRFGSLISETIKVGEDPLSLEYSVGLHYGIAELRPGDSPRALIGRADADMYSRRRANGRGPLDR